MRLLFITKYVNGKPGIIPRKLIAGLSRRFDLTVLTAQRPAEPLDVPTVFVPYPIFKYDHRLQKGMIACFGVNLFDRIWTRKAVRAVNGPFDRILGYMGFHHYPALLAGAALKRKLGCPLAMYSVDAVPAPLGWSKDDAYFRGVRRLMARYLPACDGFASSNEKMLAYQLTTFRPSPGLKTTVLFTPGSNQFRDLGPVPAGERIFLYTGGLYDARTPAFLLDAFRRLVGLRSDVRLVFLGTDLKERFLSGLDAETRERIQVFPYADDLTDWYRKATALVDIDADLPDDVYLSSKITNYIFVNRLILCETGADSSSRRLFGHIPSILQCGHDSSELLNAMETALEQAGTVDFSDRFQVADAFRLDSIIGELCGFLNALSGSIKGG